MDFVRAPTMRKKKPEQAGALESKASWVVHKPPTDMPPASTRAEGSAQEAGAQAPGGRGSSTETLPTPRLLQSSESTSSSSESVGQRPAPPPKTYSDVVGMLDQAGAAPPGQPIPAPRFTPSAAPRRPSIDRRLSEPGASSDAASADAAFNPEARFDAARAGGQQPAIPPLGLSVPNLIQRVSSGLGGLLGGLGGLLVSPQKAAAAAAAAKAGEAEAHMSTEQAAVRIQARLRPHPHPHRSPLTSHLSPSPQGPHPSPYIQARLRANEARRDVSQWAEAEIGFAQLPAVRRAELLLERFFVRDEAARTLQRGWVTHLLASPGPNPSH